MTDPAASSAPASSSGSSAAPDRAPAPDVVERALLDDPPDTGGLTPAARHALRELPPSLATLGNLFIRAGHELSLVGGPVRDAFLGVMPHDLDCTTSARPEQTE